MLNMSQISGYVCRVCESTKDLETFSKNVNRNILLMLENLGCFKTKEDNRLLQHICRPCIRNLEAFHQFKASYSSTFAKFRMKIDQMQVRDSSELAISQNLSAAEIPTTNAVVDLSTSDGFLDLQGLASKQTGRDDCKLKNSDYHTEKKEYILMSVDNAEHMVQATDSLADANDQLVNIELTAYQRPFTTRNLFRKHLAVDSDPDHNKCHVCGKSFAFASMLKEHEAIHSNPDIYKCKICNKSCMLPQYLKYHEMLDHTNLDQREQKQSEKLFSRPNRSKEHFALHFNADLLKCDTCGKSFSSISTLKVHNTLHWNPDEYKYEISNKLFSLPHNLKKYERHQYSNQDRFTCDLCGKSFKTCRSFQDHKSFHLNSNTFKCDTCNKEFTSSILFNHHQILHANPRSIQYQCKECRKIFTTERKLELHLPLHSNPNFYKCNLCGKLFKLALTYNRHKAAHSNHTFKCDICDKLFTNLDNFEAHRALHANPDLCDQVFKCDLCRQSFINPLTHKDHKAKHSNPNIYKCKVCNILFKTSTYFKIHKAIHANPDLCKCNQCGRSFATAQVLQDHQALHSSNTATDVNSHSQ